MHTHKIPGSSYVPSHSRSSLSNILEANRMSLSSTFPMRFSSRMTNSLLIISFESRRRFGIRLKKSDCKMPRKVAYSVLTCSKEYYRQKRYEAMGYSTLIHILSHTPIHALRATIPSIHRYAWNTKDSYDPHVRINSGTNEVHKNFRNSVPQRVHRRTVRWSSFPFPFASKWLDRTPGAKKGLLHGSPKR